MAVVVKNIIEKCKKMCREFHESSDKLTSAQFEKFKSTFQIKYNVHFYDYEAGGYSEFSEYVSDNFVVEDVRTHNVTQKGFLGIKFEKTKGEIRLKSIDNESILCPCNNINFIYTLNKGDKLAIAGRASIQCDLDFYCKGFNSVYGTKLYKLRINFQEFPKIKKI